VPNKQNGAKKGTHWFLLIYEDGDNIVNFYEELTEVYSELGIADCNVTLP